MLKILCFLSLLWMGAPLEARQIGLVEALELARANSEQLRIASLSSKQAGEQVDEAKAQALPQVSTEINYSRFFESPVIVTPMADFPIKNDYDLSIKVQVSQVLWAFGRVSNGIEAAKIYQKLSSIEEEKLVSEIESQVKTLFYSAIWAERKVAILEESLSNVEANRRDLRKRFARGRVPRFENLKMQSDIASRKPPIEDAKKELSDLYSQMKFFLGIAQSEPLSVQGDWQQLPEAFDPENLYQEALGSNPVLASLETQKQLAEKQVIDKKASRYPTLAAFAFIEKAGTGEKYYVGSEKLNDTAAVGIRLDYSIWDGGARGSQIANAVYDKNKAQEAISLSSKQIRTQIETIKNRIESIDRSFVLTEDALELAKQAYRLSSERYGVGQASQTELNDAEQSLTSARVGLETLKLAKQLEWIKLEQILAK